MNKLYKTGLLVVSLHTKKFDNGKTQKCSIYQNISEYFPDDSINYYYKENEVHVVTDKQHHEGKFGHPHECEWRVPVEEGGVQVEMGDGWFRGNKASFPLIP